LPIHNVVLLVGGVGGAKLAYGLNQILAPEQLTVIVNTGDDFWHYGLRICPDLDTITYTLAGLVDTSHGWGIAEDTTVTLDALSQFGQQPWFRLGDRDLATHMYRTEALRDGKTLTQITQNITSELGIQCTVLPMTDQPVATMIDTVEYGEIPFQEYFVKHRWQPALKQIRLEGVENAKLNPVTQRAIEQSDAVIIGPSNPWLSIRPILATPGISECLVACDIPKVAVTPIINGNAVKGPTAKIMRELGYEVSPNRVIDEYRDIINGFIIDSRDQLQVSGVRSVAMDTLMNSDTHKINLAKNILTWLEDWN